MIQTRSIVLSDDILMHVTEGNIFISMALHLSGLLM